MVIICVFHTTSSSLWKVHTNVSSGKGKGNWLAYTNSSSLCTSETLSVYWTLPLWMKYSEDLYSIFLNISSWLNSIQDHYTYWGLPAYHEKKKCPMHVRSTDLLKCILWANRVLSPFAELQVNLVEWASMALCALKKSKSDFFFASSFHLSSMFKSRKIFCIRFNILRLYFSNPCIQLD